MDYLKHSTDAANTNTLLSRFTASLLIGLKPLQIAVFLPQWRSLSVTIPHTGQTYLTCASEPRTLSVRHPEKPRSATKSPHLKLEASNISDIAPITAAPAKAAALPAPETPPDKPGLMSRRVQISTVLPLESGPSLEARLSERDSPLRQHRQR